MRSALGAHEGVLTGSHLPADGHSNAHFGSAYATTAWPGCAVKPP
jgi:hypothetical protein